MTLKSPSPRSRSHSPIAPLGRLVVHAVEGAGVDQGPRAHVGLGEVLAPAGRGPGGGLRVPDHRPHRQAVLPGEGEVPLVVGGDGHHRPGAVLHEHVVGHPDRHRLPVDGVHHRGSGVEAGLLQVGVGLAGGALVLHLPHLGQEPLPVRVPGQEFLHQRVLGGQDHVGHPAQGVDAGGEAFHRLAPAGTGEAQGDSLAPADPVPLHGHHPLRPVGQGVQVVQQRLGVAGGLEEPLGELALLDLGAAPLAGALHHLLVGEHGGAGRAPVDGGVPLLGQPALEELEEDPLGPAVVAGMAGGDLPGPVQPDPPLVELGLELLDVLQGPGQGVDAVLDGRVLGRQAEGVEAHGGEDFIALHDLPPHHHVPQDVVPAVADVEVPRGVREHVQAVVLGLGRSGVAAEEAARLPPVPPLGLEFPEGIAPPGLSRSIRRLRFHANLVLPHPGRTGPAVPPRS